SGAVKASDPLEEKLLARHRSRLKGLIGVAEFDLGHFGTAGRWLAESIAEQRGEGEREALAWTLSFAGQLHTATGRFEEAVHELGEAVDLTKDSMAASYHRLLLGKTYLEWDGNLANGAAPSLLARLALERGEGTEAVDWSAGAVSILRKKKWFTPTVRTEEVLFVHSIALRQAGRAEAADAFLRGAMRVLQRKAKSIPD